ncbi:RNA polymerase [Piparella virus]|nr:RNA polymerase [Piparella virus]
MDLLGGGANVNDIIYPECHLDSPIVTGKLVELVFYTNLPLNPILEDPQLLKNLQGNTKTGRRSFVYKAQNQLGNAVRDVYPNVASFTPVDYPSGNFVLFRKSSKYLTTRLNNLMDYAGTCYKKISDRIVKLRNETNKQLGLNKATVGSDTSDYHESSSIKHLAEIMKGSKWYDSFLYWFTIKTEMRDLMKSSSRDFKNNRPMYISHNLESESVFLNRNLVVIVEPTKKSLYYLTNEMVLMMCDVLEGRMMIDVGMSVDYRLIDLKPKGHKLWEFIDMQFTDLGNRTYDLVAMIEPLVLGFLQLRDITSNLRGAFLDYCLHDLIEIYVNAGITDDETHSLILDLIFDIFNLQDIHMIAEFFSFFRTFGHPTLEATNAANKVRSYMNKPKVVKFITMMKGHAIFCGTIINGYRDRHGGAWPPLVLPNHASNRIKQAQNNAEGLTDHLCITHWQSFSGIKFHCFMPLTLDDDLTMYMKDKALAALKSEWDSVYPRASMSYDPPRQTSSRRLVEVFLSDNQFDPINLINYVLSGEYLEDEEFNISYSLKEKEIKQVGRLFAKMTYKMRACQVVAESLISSGVGKFFQENGMAKNEHELLKTLHKLSLSSVPKDNKIGKSSDTKQNINNNNNKPHIQSGKGVGQGIQYETVSTFLTTDLQKFCLNWRQEVTNLFAERLNEIYGLPGFFNWQHKILEKSILYVADPHCPPKYDHHIDLDNVDNDQIFIKYPMGGIEGYSQKLWTITTIPFLFLSAYEVGTKIAAVVQGDNQAIAITARVHPNLPYNEKKVRSSLIAQRFFYRLRENLGDIGHNLKANETIISSNFFVYSKRIYYDGVVLSQSLKPLSRTVFWSETLVDETRSACSNISTSISKSIEQGFSRWLGYSINVLKIIQQLMISLKFTINENMTNDIVNPIYHNPYWIICASLVPAQIGGYNYMNISRLYVRNIGDPVTASFADVKRLVKSGLLNPKILQKIMHQKSGNSTYLDWASDPYSVNIPHSQSITTVLKNVTSRTILQNSENPMLRGLFHFDFEKEDHDLAEFLLNRPIILPRAAHEIMDKSLTGARQEIAGMLDTTKGLVRNSIRAGGIHPGLMKKLALYDYEQFRVFNNLMSIKEVDPLITIEACSVKLAITLRKRMWRDLANGRQIYGLEVPDSIEVLQGYFLNDCEDCYYCMSNQQQYGWFFCPPECQLDDVSRETNSLRVPYFGSTTEERSEIKLSNVKNASRALRSAIRIATVYTWAYGDTDENWEEAWYLASFRANVTLDELKAITPISTSNNIAHRLRDKSTQMKYASTALNRVGRYITISNDSLNFVIEGRKIDTNLIYQQIMLMGIAVFEEKFRFCSTTGFHNTVLHMHIQTSCCVVEMTDHPYIESHKPLPTLQKVDCNKLIYDDDPIIEKTQNIITQQIYKSGLLDFPRWDLQELNDTLCKSLAVTLIEIITKENKDHLSEFKTLSSEDDINSLITEFLLVDPETFTLNLGMYMSVNWAYDIYYRRPVGKYQMIDYMATILSTASKSLFQVLANALSHPKVFQRFWDSGIVEPIYGPNLSSQDYYKASIDLMVWAYQQYLNYWLDDNELDYILSESEEEIIDQRYENLQSKHLCMLSSLYLSRERMPVILNMTSIEKCAILHQRLIDDQYKEGIVNDWNLEPLPVIVYPASTTYIRRGVIKHIRLRNLLSSEAVALDKLYMERHPSNQTKMPIPAFDKHEYHSYYFRSYLLFSNDYLQLQDNPWYNDQKNYWENHVSRRIGINSTSCYKAVELAHFLKDKVSRLDSRLFLGEGSGAMMITYYNLLGETKTYYNTGVYNTEVLGQRILTVNPSEALLVEKQGMWSHEFSRNLIRLFNGKPESSWIGTNDSFVYIMSQIEIHSLGMIHNDMESSSEKDSATILKEQIYSLCLALNLGDSHSVYVTKLAPKSQDYTTQFLNLCSLYYEEVYCFLPFSSNPYSSEIYLVMLYPKIRTVVNPQVIVQNIDFDDYDKEILIGNIIVNFKIRRYTDIVQNKARFDDYISSDLVDLTDTEKVLMSMGFQLNGPKIVRSLIRHDTAAGPQVLKDSINTFIHNIIVQCDVDRDTTAFFDPYPLKNDSKIRELMHDVTRKIVAYFILYGHQQEKEMRKRCISNLRRKHLFIDFNSPDIKNILTKKLYKDFKKCGLKEVSTIPLETNEIKKWWKIVGYSLLLIKNMI